MNIVKFVTFAFVCLFLSTNFVFAGDAAKGQKLFTKCKACHNAEAPKHKVGPHLVGIIGRKAGTAEGYKKYSKVLKDSGIVWDEANLDKWLENPKGMYPGTKMLYPGLKKAEDRADVIEYLKTK